MSLCQVKIFSACKLWTLTAKSSLYAWSIPTSFTALTIFYSLTLRLKCMYSEQLLDDGSQRNLHFACSIPMTFNCAETFSIIDYNAHMHSALRSCLRLIILVMRSMFSLKTGSWKSSYFYALISTFAQIATRILTQCRWVSVRWRSSQSVYSEL